MKASKKRRRAQAARAARVSLPARENEAVCACQTTESGSRSAADKECPSRSICAKHNAQESNEACQSTQAHEALANCACDGAMDALLASKGAQDALPAIDGTTDALPARDSAQNAREAAALESALAFHQANEQHPQAGGASVADSCGPAYGKAGATQLFSRNRKAETARGAGTVHSVPLAAFLCAAFAFYELILRFVTVERLWGPGIVFAPLFAVPIALLLWLLCACFAPCGARGVLSCAAVCTGVGYVLFASQMVYHAVFHTYYTLFSAGHGAQVTEFMGVILSTIARQSGWLLLLALPLAVLAVLWKKGLLCAGCAVRKAAQATAQAPDGTSSPSTAPAQDPTSSPPPRRIRVRLRAALLAFAVQFVALCALPLCGFGQNTPFALYFQTRVLTESVDKLGLLTTLRHDATDLLFGFDEASAPGVDVGTLTVKDYFSESGEEAQAGADANSATAQPDGIGNPDFERRPQTLDIDFAALADAEPNAAIAQLHRDVAAREPTYTNAKTGLFAGKNLIYIVAESFSPYAISETLTPTLYKMQHDGWYFPHFYTGVWGVSTLDGEYVADVGLVPKQGVWSMYLSAFNTLPFTLGNAFRADGASTYAYHNGLYDYYARQASHPNLGYIYKGVNGGLTMTNEWPRSDKELVDITVDDFIADDYFHVYYLTISGHLPYDASDAQAMKHADAVADLPYSQHVKNYLAANRELDKAMEALLARLEAAGRLDDTVLVLSPDHYPYGLTNAEISELAGHAVETEFELHKSSLILYHAPTQGETVKKMCSSLDLVPTMLNLFGLPYDARLLAGQDIFSDSEGFVPFVTKSFLTDTVRYNAVTNEATPLTPGGVSAEYVAQRSAYLSQIFSLSRRILDTNYYSYLPPEALPVANAVQ